MRRFLRWSLVLAAVTLVMPAPAMADLRAAVEKAILKLPRKTTDKGQTGTGQIFNGKLEATITDGNRNPGDFADGDFVDFTLTSVSGQQVLSFRGTHAEFLRFVSVIENEEKIKAILFSTSLSESASGANPAQNHSQQLLLSTVLATGGRGNIGGRLEFEQFKQFKQGISGNAVQGLFRVNAFATEARYARLDDSDTHSATFGANLHPSWGRTGSSTEWRVGADGYLSALYANYGDVGLHTGSLDYGGGGWASGRKDFSRASVSFGSLLLGSKTKVPSGWIHKDFQFIADQINKQAVSWDFTYGGTLQYLLTPQVSLGTKALQSRALDDAGRTSQLLLVSVAYLVGGDSPLDFGYRFSNGEDEYRAHAVFINANFTW